MEMRHLRWARNSGLLLLVSVALALATPAQRPHNVAEQYLYQAANAERRMRGLPALQWDDALYAAARRHAWQMAERFSIAHQYEGEADLAERVEHEGGRFSEVAENVAEAPSAPLIHRGWMESEHHRENLLDPRLDRIAISVLERDGELFAVEDFDRGVAVLSLAEQERTVASLLTEMAPITIDSTGTAARATCQMETGFAGGRRPWFVMRFTAASLVSLPEELRRRLATGRYREAQVGACPLRDAGSFSGYSLAVLLFP